MQTATEVRRAGPRVRIKNWTQRDALLLVGCAYAGIAFAWLLFRVTPLEGVFGFVVCAYLAFVAIYWFVVRDVEGPLLASDRVVSVIVASAAGFVLVPLVLIIGFARAVGETAPLIMTAFGSSLLNGNLFAGAQSALPLFSYALIRSPQQSQIDRAWTGALVLIAIVLGLFTLARVLGNRAGKGRGRRLRKRGAKT